MKLAVINFSGNVGKSTIARHLLAPRIPDAQVIAVESINADDGPSTTIRGRQFAELQDFLQAQQKVVVDVGASNVEDFITLMCRYTGSHTDFDAFVLPTVPARKQQQDTAATLTELARIGVPADRIRLVFNQVTDDRPIEKEFETLLAFCAASGAAVPIMDAHLRFNEIYARLRGSDQSISEVASDPTDYKAMIAATASVAERLKLAQALASQRLARGVIHELDACFAALALTELELSAAGYDGRAT